MKIKHISLKKLHKKAWKLQSDYIRQLEKGVCFTCGDKRNWKEQQAGHYIHGNKMDFYPINIHCQCVRCNKWLHGNQGVYGEKLIKIYGMDKVEEIREIEKKEKKYTIFELEDLIKGYQEALKDLIIGG